jgi:hypothetical protein
LKEIEKNDEKIQKVNKIISDLNNLYYQITNKPTIEQIDYYFVQKEYLKSLILNNKEYNDSNFLLQEFDKKFENLQNFYKNYLQHQQIQNQQIGNNNNNQNNQFIMQKQEQQFFQQNQFVQNNQPQQFNPNNNNNNFNNQNQQYYQQQQMQNQNQQYYQQQQMQNQQQQMQNQQQQIEQEILQQLDISFESINKKKVITIEDIQYFSQQWAELKLFLLFEQVQELEQHFKRNFDFLQKKYEKNQPSTNKQDIATMHLNNKPQNTDYNKSDLSKYYQKNYQQKK